VRFFLAVGVVRRDGVGVPLRLLVAERVTRWGVSLVVLMRLPGRKSSSSLSSSSSDEGLSEGGAFRFRFRTGVALRTGVAGGGGGVSKESVEDSFSSVILRPPTPFSLGILCGVGPLMGALLVAAEAALEAAFLGGALFGAAFLGAVIFEAAFLGAAFFVALFLRAAFFEVVLVDVFRLVPIEGGGESESSLSLSLEDSSSSSSSDSAESEMSL